MPTSQVILRCFFRLRCSILDQAVNNRYRRLSSANCHVFETTYVKVSSVYIKTWDSTTPSKSLSPGDRKQDSFRPCFKSLSHLQLQQTSHPQLYPQPTLELPLKLPIINERHLHPFHLPLPLLHLRRPLPPPPRHPVPKSTASSMPWTGAPLPWHPTLLFYPSRQDTPRTR